MKMKVGGCSDPLSLVMEYSPLGTLSDILKIDPAALLDDRITKIALDVAKGMKFLHSKTFLHYNLTSSNVVVTSDWTAKISGSFPIPFIFPLFVFPTNNDEI